jgi:Na+/proline symporter
MAAVLAAAMSNLSAALNALASTTVMDFWKPLARVERSEAEYLRLSRWITVAWGGVLFAIALVAQSIQSVLESGLSIASIVYGCLLGVFLLGVLTKRTGEKAAMAGMLAGLLTNLYVKFGTTIAWTWYVLIGAAVTVATAVLLSLFLNEERVRHG